MALVNITISKIQDLVSPDPVAQWLEHLPGQEKVVGSIPTWVSLFPLFGVD